VREDRNSHALDAVRDRIGQVKKPICALCGQPVKIFTATLEPTRAGHFDAKFEAECCGCYEMSRLRGTCCHESTGIAFGPAFASHPLARFGTLS
jgi:hypothetical protein